MSTNEFTNVISMFTPRQIMKLQLLGISKPFRTSVFDIYPSLKADYKATITYEKLRLQTVDMRY